VSGVHFQNIAMLHLLWCLPVLAGLYLAAAHWRRQALERFAEAGLLARISLSVSAARRRWKAAAVLAGFAFIVAALVRPAWNPKPKMLERRGRDVVFVLDVSKSMLAEDLAPNRLERAKLAIRDCLERLEGDRVGLVGFAGKAALKCPLTLDYGFFRMMLEGIGPDSVPQGGTLIGDAVRMVLDDVFDDQERQFKDIILITDGEDHESFPVRAAEEAGRRGVRILAIGLGDAEQGRRIPVTDADGRKGFLTYKGQEVFSRLDADTLRKMVNATPGGRYIEVATGTIDLGQVYADLVTTAEKKALESRTIKRYEEKFQIFIAVAFALLCAEAMVSERRRRAAATP
jgi:Ca-activated chloride channel family protein